MKAIMYSVYDIIQGAYRAPFYATNEADGKRAFQLILGSNDLMKNNPNDFELHMMGFWDDKEGITYVDKKTKEAMYLVPERIFKGGEVFYEQVDRNTI